MAQDDNIRETIRGKQSPAAWLPTMPLWFVNTSSPGEELANNTLSNINLCSLSSSTKSTPRVYKSLRVHRSQSVHEFHF